MRLSEIANHVKGVSCGEDREISSFSINTRTLKMGDLYIAIKGHNFDGHTFINKAIDAGAIAVLVENKAEIDLPQIIVKDTHLALAELAGAWKAKADVKTIAITGSNGKTTVKEMVAAILRVSDEVLFTKGNLNNEIGVPLTLLQIDEKHKFAVVEMGANHAGEIKYCSRYAKPDVAVITNVGAAHLEGFGDLKGVATAKAEIIQSLDAKGIAVLNRDDEFYDFWQKLAKGRLVLTFGLNQVADISAVDIESEICNNTFVTKFNLVTANEEEAIQLKLAGKHNVINALAAAASCICVGIDLPQIKKGLENLKPVKGRLEPLAGKQGCIVIDDTYNANPDSFKAALDVLMQCGKQPWVVMGALAELGSDSLKIHQELGELIKSMNVVRLLAIGSAAETTSNSFGNGATFFNSQEDLIATLKQELKGEEVLLIKGSRSQKMENVVSALINDSRNIG